MSRVRLQVLASTRRRGFPPQGNRLHLQVGGEPDPAIRRVESSIQIGKTQSERARCVVALRRFGGCLKVIFPAAGISTGALIRVAMVEVTREEATSGVGYAERSMNENLEFHVRTFLTNLRDLIERQFPR